MNSFQQPVNAEPSVGTLHPITPTVIVDNVSPANTNVMTVDISAVVPVGCKMVMVAGNATSSDTAVSRNVRSYMTDGEIFS